MKAIAAIFNPRNCVSALLASTLGLVSLVVPSQTNNAALAATNEYCQPDREEISKKEQLLKLSLSGDTEAKQQYQSIVAQHANTLQQCRQQHWLKKQAIWLRLYPCDATPGSLDYVLDRIVNQGYNQIHLEVFYSGQVLLPSANNPTPWTSVLRSPEYRNLDLLKQTIEKGHQRGLKVYAWLYTMNFGYSYTQITDRKDALARNGQGANSLNIVSDGSQAFIDPYNRQVQEDYYRLVNAVLKRKPDGVLFDYIRYPRGSGNQSLVSNVKDLWIYSPASLQTLYNRGLNKKGRALIQQYTRQGKITINDLKAVDRQYPDETEPSWQGRRVVEVGTKNNLQNEVALRDRFLRVQSDLWFLTVAHAAQGVIDFLSFAATPAKQQNIAAGGVFFPDANRLIGSTGFDSRLQAWDKFPSFLELHPMAYSVCNGTQCIIDEIQTVLDRASPDTKITPALAGVWGQEYRNHPPLEEQMASLRQAFPNLDSVSHFAYSWQEPEIDRQRKFCEVR